MSRSDLAGKAAAPKIARPVPLRESVFEALLELIISSHLRPGQHLAESELAEMLGVSRQPIREALQLLSGEGWVDLHPGHGAFVHAPTAEEADQLLAVRALLETEAARLAARHHTEEGVALLRALCSRGLAAVEADDVEGAVAINSELHATVMELSGNMVLSDLAAQVSRRVRWYHTPVARQRGRASWEEHAALIAAIADGDEDQAGEIMKNHTEQTRHLYLSQLGEDEPAEPLPSKRRKRRAPAALGN
ncbi:GntR family transcriptional regulator [Sphaerisporangium corydalis]|uniref:GntR family transcriptional regulator n=1 Tax=Sphaerisporangium corydalis TaxID=1441875 RepID=A0ABV9EJ67_9ACTN|nr:GntR family transcriptional regulator [Sphaerisporangium corydalis]